MTAPHVAALSIAIGETTSKLDVPFVNPRLAESEWGVNASSSFCRSPVPDRPWRRPLE